MKLNALAKRTKKFFSKDRVAVRRKIRDVKSVMRYPPNIFSESSRKLQRSYLKYSDGSKVFLDKLNKLRAREREMHNYLDSGASRYNSAAEKEQFRHELEAISLEAHKLEELSKSLSKQARLDKEKAVILKLIEKRKKKKN